MEPTPTHSRRQQPQPSFTDVAKAVFLKELRQNEKSAEIEVCSLIVEYVNSTAVYNKTFVEDLFATSLYLTKEAPLRSLILLLEKTIDSIDNEEVRAEVEDLREILSLRYSSLPHVCARNLDSPSKRRRGSQERSSQKDEDGPLTQARYLPRPQSRSSTYMTDQDMATSFSTLLGSSVGLCFVFKDERMVVNAGIEQLTGYSSQEIATLDSWFSKLYAPYHQELLQFYRAEAANGFRSDPGGGASSRVVQFRRKDGEMVYGKFWGFPVQSVFGGRDSNSHLANVWVVVSVHDEVSRSLALEGSRTAESLTLDSLKEVVVRLDSEGRLLSWNRMAEDTLKDSGALEKGALIEDCMPRLETHCSESGRRHLFSISEFISQSKARLLSEQDGREGSRYAQDGDTTTSATSDRTSAVAGHPAKGSFCKVYMGNKGSTDQTSFLVKLVPVTSSSSKDYLTMEGLDESSMPLEGRAHKVFGLESDGLHGFVLCMEEMDSTERVLDAEKRARERSLFLSVMSHEIRTPLNGIVGIVEELDSQAEHLPEIREHTESLRCSSDTLLTLVNNVLDFSKLDSGAMELSLGRVQLVSEVTRLLRTFEGQAKKLGLSLDFASTGLDISREEFLVDWRKLMQVLMNLVSNALKFTPRVAPSGAPGFVCLTIATSPPSPSLRADPCTPSCDSSRLSGGDDEMVLTFSVRDNGIGIVPSQQRDIFEVFRQADASIHGKYGGTGLGLSITKRLVELMGSKIELESTVNEGSCFSFSLPLRRASTPPSPARPSSAQAAVPECNDDALERVSTMSSTSAAVSCASNIGSVSVTSRGVNAGAPSSVAGSLPPYLEQSSLARAPWEPLKPLSLSRSSGAASVAIVDDDAVNVKVARLTLKRIGYREFSTFGDGTFFLSGYLSILSKQLLRLLSSLSLDDRRAMVSSGSCPPLGYSFVVMDLHMPCMDGTTATRHCFNYHVRALHLLCTFSGSSAMREGDIAVLLKEEDPIFAQQVPDDVIARFCVSVKQHCPQISPSTLSSYLSVCPRILASSADVDPAVQIRCLHAGMLRFISKPCTLQVVEETVTTFCPLDVKQM